MARAIAAVLVVVLAIAGNAEADSWIRFVNLRRVFGPVEIDRAKGKGFERAILSMPVSEGVRLRTSTEGRAAVQFEDGSILRLSSESEVSFSKLMLLSSGYRSSVVRIFRGGVRLNFRNAGKDHLRVVFPGGEVELNRPAEFFLHVEGDQAMLSVEKGKVTVQQGGQVMTVRKNETRAFEYHQPPEMATAHESASTF
ncbi:MAG: FecR domain-containing protein [Candidatus Korobacteraceae bacterium]